MNDVTRILSDIEEGDPHAAGQLLPLVYDELRKLAAKRLGVGSGADGNEAQIEFLGVSTKPGTIGRLGHYEVLQVIGKGGFGIVLKAFDEKLHRIVAIVFAQDTAKYKGFTPISKSEVDKFAGVWEATVKTADGWTGTLHAIVSLKPTKAEGAPIVVSPYSMASVPRNTFFLRKLLTEAVFARVVRRIREHDAGTR